MKLIQTYFHSYDEFYNTWDYLLLKINDEECKVMSLLIREATVTFEMPYVLCIESKVIALAVMRLLLKYTYHTGSSYGKFLIGYRILIPLENTLVGGQISYRDQITFLIGRAIPLVDLNQNMLPNKYVYSDILKLVNKKAPSE